MTQPLFYNAYRAWCFDCDGVIFDSNDIKTQAFYQMALPYGESRASELVAYHQSTTGRSRFHKAEHLFQGILQYPHAAELIKTAVEQFNQRVWEQMLRCPETKGVRSFLEMTPTTIPKYVISGGFYQELRSLFKERGIEGYFEKIYGSPYNKDKIFKILKESYQLQLPSVYIGDSQYDHESAMRAGLDFIFLSGYTDFEEWPDYFAQYREVPVFDNFEELQSNVRF